VTLAEVIHAEIAANGPMRIDRFMGLCLMHPTLGYYQHREPFGAKGDFVTAPEISQMFGEMIGLWIAQAWQDQGARPVTLVEVGPGRGTLMADALRVCRSVPGFAQTVSVCLVEQSERLVEAQKAALGSHVATWITSIADLPKGPIFLVANEFFDALPIRQAERIDAVWLERVIRTEPGGAFRFGHQPLDADTAATLPKAARDGEIIEWSDAAQRIAARIGAQVESEGGAALFIDYGQFGGSGDTLQAVHNHAYAAPLENLGKSDLSAQVDFAALAKAAKPAIAAPLTEQGSFLAALGIGSRAQALAERGSAEEIADALERLTDPSKMGSLFKVLGLRPSAAPPLPGLE